MNNGNEILFITSYPSRECGIATYSRDLIQFINEKFGESFSLKIAALESNNNSYSYDEDVKFIFQTNDILSYFQLAEQINNDDQIKLVFIQHEFGLFGGENGEYLLHFLEFVKKKVLFTFHTVLPNPNEHFKKLVNDLAEAAAGIIVMTNSSANILIKDYGVEHNLISIIPHGTHLIDITDSEKLKSNYSLQNKIVLSTFGLLSSGKSIETALNALPSIIEAFPNVIYFILGKTHPAILKEEGEKYRNYLKQKALVLNITDHVKFVDSYLSLDELLEYLQLTDIYLFTSKDPNQAVSGTFSYAMGCGCPVVSTPIPQAVELLTQNAGIVVDFSNHQQIAVAVKKLLNDKVLRKQMSLNAQHLIRPTCWQNSAIAHGILFKKIINDHQLRLGFQIPPINLDHIKNLTTPSGMLQFSHLSEPDPDSGYTLDDNARALVAMIWHYETTGDFNDTQLIETYLNFIIYSQQPDGKFLNYIDIEGKYYAKNADENLEDSNARAIWALGELVAKGSLFHPYFVHRAEVALISALNHIRTMKSPRAMAFVIKGFYLFNTVHNNEEVSELISVFADDLVGKFKSVSDNNWKWFEHSLTYANSILPDALMYAYLETGKQHYREFAILSFDFLLNIIFPGEKIKVVSHNGWLIQGQKPNSYGEQPIDVAYTVLSLHLFYQITGSHRYRENMQVAFSWFHGNNHLNQIIYNPATGGCCDGLEEKHVNLNQGAESTVCYLLSRLIMDKYKKEKRNLNVPKISPAYLPFSGNYQSGKAPLDQKRYSKLFGKRQK